MLKNLKSFFSTHQTALFFTFTLVLTWIPVFTVAATGKMNFLLQIAVLGPLGGAAIVTFVAGGSLRKWAGQVLNWPVEIRWYLVAFGLPFLLVLCNTLLFLILSSY